MQNFVAVVLYVGLCWSHNLVDTSSLPLNFLIQRPSACRTLFVAACVFLWVGTTLHRSGLTILLSTFPFPILLQLPIMGPVLAEFCFLLCRSLWDPAQIWWSIILTQLLCFLTCNFMTQRPSQYFLSFVCCCVQVLLVSQSCWHYCSALSFLTWNFLIPYTALFVHK